MDSGSFIISLDFELFWGVRDSRTLQSYGENVLGVREVMPKLIDLLNKYDVKVTIATVGLLFCNSVEEVINNKPIMTPTYMNNILSPFENNYLDSLKPTNDPFHTALDTINILKSCDNVELASHTFSHYYCWEEGQTIGQFEADVNAFLKIANEKNVQISSIVFPRNQVSEEYLKVCAFHGINVYRGNPKRYFDKVSHKNRLFRLVDTYFPTFNDTTYSYNDIPTGDMYNIKASRFLKPYSKRTKLFDWLKTNRIKNEMTKAAKSNRVYHLWWHPHNFGINQKENLNMLEKILIHYQKLNKKHQFSSYTMGELSVKLEQLNCKNYE